MAGREVQAETAAPAKGGCGRDFIRLASGLLGFNRHVKPFFQLSDHGTTVPRELAAGLTTFAAMA